ncbi:MAG: aspartate carbamoyltransferase regulatory subunit [Candidatus Anammoxibacter sp.]
MVIDNLPKEKIVEVANFIEFLNEKYNRELKEELKDSKLEGKDIIKSPQEERTELEKQANIQKNSLINLKIT